jgi:hypothetical protein
MHQPIPKQGQWLKQIVTVHYHAVPTNSRALGRFHHHIAHLWLRVLRRRSKRGWHHVRTDREVGRRVTPESAHPSSLAQRALRHQSPKVGAVCPNRARTDRCVRCSVWASLPDQLGRWTQASECLQAKIDTNRRPKNTGHHPKKCNGHSRFQMQTVVRFEGASQGGRRASEYSLGMASDRKEYKKVRSMPWETGIRCPFPYQLERHLAG